MARTGRRVPPQRENLKDAREVGARGRCQSSAFLAQAVHGAGRARAVAQQPLGGVVIALPIELARAGHLKPGLEVPSYRLVQQTPAHTKQPDSKKPEQSPTRALNIQVSGRLISSLAANPHN